MAAPFPDQTPGGGAVPVPVVSAPAPDVSSPPRVQDLLAPGVEAIAATAVGTDGAVEAWSALPADLAAPGPATWAIPRTNEFGGPLHLRALDQQGPWLRVQLPVRPNGTEGWVRRQDVELRPVLHRVEVSLSQRSLRVFEGEAVVFETSVVVGRSAHPTPRGEFYLRDSFAWNPSSVYGPFVLPLSAFSDTVEVINGGDAVVAIHGTNRPDLLGTAASLGCIRMGNTSITTLAHLIEPGTPVTIGI
jgi:lipoprotein-anchoring transpeptidase ErfK/SrfK